MIKSSQTLGIEVIKYTFDRLPVSERIKLVKELERRTRRQRWDAVVGKIRKRAPAKGISPKDISQICEKTRQRLYEKRVTRSH